MSARKLNDHDFLELYNEGLMDIEIAEIMDVSVTAVNNRRRRMGLPKNRQHRRDAKKYTVYNSETDELLMEGTVWDISQKLGMYETTVRDYVNRTKYGAHCRYKIREIRK